MSQTSFEDTVSEHQEGLRLDVYLTDVLDDRSDRVSRSFVKKLIKDARVVVNGGVCKRPGRTMACGDNVRATIPPPPDTTLRPEDMPLDILYEDRDLVVVNKPSGLVMHPAPGHYAGTLVHAILYHCPDFQHTGDQAARPGIVHRLDRFTSGALVVAKSPAAYASLAAQAREHSFDRRYLALVSGEFREDRGRINATVGRSLSDPARMSVTGVRGRDAVTNFEILERFGVASLVSLVLETGRTHQIRVHLRFAGHPVLGDPVYGVTDYTRRPFPDEVREALEQLDGQALHAERLGFQHPTSGERMTFTAPPPQDFQRALDALRAATGCAQASRPQRA